MPLPEEPLELRLFLLPVSSSPSKSLLPALIAPFDLEKSVSSVSPEDRTRLRLKAGLNRFVWDMRYQSLPGIPTAYIEGSYRGHKAMPNLYSASLKLENKTAEVSFKILPNPLYNITKEDKSQNPQKSNKNIKLTETLIGIPNIASPPNQ